MTFSPRFSHCPYSKGAVPSRERIVLAVTNSRLKAAQSTKVFLRHFPSDGLSAENPQEDISRTICVHAGSLKRSSFAFGLCLVVQVVVLTIVLQAPPLSFSGIAPGIRSTSSQAAWPWLSDHVCPCSETSAALASRVNSSCSARPSPMSISMLTRLAAICKFWNSTKRPGMAA